MESRLAMYTKVPGVYEAIKETVRQRKRNRVFVREMEGVIPGNTMCWRDGPFPSLTQDQIKSYVKPKLPGGLIKNAKRLEPIQFQKDRQHESV